MEIPESERPETRSSSMAEEEGQEPSVSRHDHEGAGTVREVELQQQAGGVQGLEKKPHEIESLDSSRAGVSSSNKNLDTDLSKVATAGTSSKDVISDAGPSSAKVGTAPRNVGIRIGPEEDSNHRVDERSSGAEGGTGSEENLKEGDPPRQQREADDPSLPKSTAAAGAAGAPPADTTAAQFRSAGPFVFPTRFLPSDKSTDAHHIDIPPLRTSSKVEELDSYKRFPVARTLSNFSRASTESAMGDHCRICQQHTEEPLMELGCQCRGDLAKAHKTCIDHWFGNKGTNKCEVCQHVATNVPPPSSLPSPHFWVWRVGGPYANPRRNHARFHPLWAALLILIAGLLFDILISIFLGASALPVNIIIGVLVVLGLGTAARLVLECWHERVIRRNIQRMEEEPNFEDFPPDQSNIDIQTEPAEGQTASNIPSEGTAVQSAPEASVTASVAATSAPDEVNR